MYTMEWFLLHVHHVMIPAFRGKSAFLWLMWAHGGRSLIWSIPVLWAVTQISIPRCDWLAEFISSHQDHGGSAGGMPLQWPERMLHLCHLRGQSASLVGGPQPWTGHLWLRGRWHSGCLCQTGKRCVKLPCQLLSWWLDWKKKRSEKWTWKPRHVVMLDGHLHWLLWMCCPGHAGVKGTFWADRLVGLDDSWFVRLV